MPFILLRVYSPPCLVCPSVHVVNCCDADDLYNTERCRRGLINNKLLGRTDGRPAGRRHTRHDSSFARILSHSMVAMAVALLLVGFVVGVLSVAVAEAAAFLWAIRNFSTARPSSSSNSRGTTPPPPPPPLPLGDLKRQVASNSIPFIHSIRFVASNSTMI